MSGKKIEEIKFPMLNKTDDCAGVGMESVINIFLYIARCQCLEVAKATNSHYTHSQLNIGY
jgi:hypothetical protein